MRSIITLLIATFASISTFAEDFRAASLTVSSTGSQNLVVLVDNEMYRSGDNVIRIPDVSPGYHNVKVYRESYGNRRGRNVSNSELIYSSSVHLKPRSQVELTIDRNGRAEIRERFASRINDRYNEVDQRNGRNNRFEDRNTYDNRVAIKKNDFNRMMLHLRNETFETSRLVKARQMLNSNYFTTHQVRAMIQEFSFEQHKLDIAKQAYARTIDVTNYYNIINVFSFDSSKRSLEEYIQKMNR